jgi:hypothetical protein
MTKERMTQEYFDWMRRLVYDKKYSRRLSWRKLLRFLHVREFIHILDMDKNRADDGIDLRYRFAYENGYEQVNVETSIDDRPCSVLEMMIALAIRCEEHIMDDPTIGNRTGQWFWGMIQNLGLSSMDDAHFDASVVREIITKLLKREYGADGKGGLFTVGQRRSDLRMVEIWYQAMWFLDEYGKRLQGGSNKY